MYHIQVYHKPKCSTKHVVMQTMYVTVSGNKCIGRMCQNHWLEKSSKNGSAAYAFGNQAPSNSVLRNMYQFHVRGKNGVVEPLIATEVPAIWAVYRPVFPVDVLKYFGPLIHVQDYDAAQEIG